MPPFLILLFLYHLVCIFYKTNSFQKGYRRNRRHINYYIFITNPSSFVIFKNSFVELDISLQLISNMPIISLTRMAVSPPIWMNIKTPPFLNKLLNLYYYILI